MTLRREQHAAHELRVGRVCVWHRRVSKRFPRDGIQKCGAVSHDTQNHVLMCHMYECVCVYVHVHACVNWVHIVLHNSLRS